MFKQKTDLDWDILQSLFDVPYVDCLVQTTGYDPLSILRES